MRALILGAHGQVGRALVAAAPAAASVTALSRADCDLGDAAAIERAVAEAGPELIFNAAAYTAVDEAEREPAVAERVNAVAPGLIAGAAKKAAARFVHLSTDFVFDGSASTPRRPTDAVNPTGVYARTKLAGEQAAAAADPTALIVRTAWVYAPSGKNFVTTMLRLMLERGEVGVVADQIGTPTAAFSIAAALWGLAGTGATGIHHYTDAGVASWYDFAVAIAEEGFAAGLLEREPRVDPIATLDYPTPAQRPAYSVLDNRATWALLGRPAHHWRANLRTVIREMERA